MKSPLTSHQLHALGRLDTCSVANAIDTFNVRLRNEGYANSTVRSVFPHFAPMVGYATTLKIRAAATPLTGHPYIDRTDWWGRILELPEPRIVVIEDVDDPPGAGAFIGGVHANILHALGCVGVITNGAVRDTQAVERIPFQLFAGSLAVSHAYVHIVSMGEPVTIGGLQIATGDLLHGDRHGLLSVPIEIAGKIPAAAAELAHKEDKLIALCRSRNVTPEQLSQAVQS